MTKNKLILAAGALAGHSAVIAGNVLLTGRISPFSQQGFSALPIHLFAFLGLSLLVLTIKQQMWQIGGILAALSTFLRACTTNFPDQKMAFGVSTLMISLGAITALTASWRVEELDLVWWERGKHRSSFRSAFAILAALAMVGIFLYWGKE